MIRMMGLVTLPAIGNTPVGSYSVQEELSGAQQKLDVDGDGEIEDEDLAKLRSQQNEVGWSDDGYDAARDRRAMSGLPRKPMQQPNSTGSNAGVLGQMVRYKDMDGKDREATVKSLLSYPKEHPGRKIAARMYAQHMTSQRGKQIKESLSEENPTPSNDHEVSMANNSLDTIIQMANELKTKIGQEEKDIPAWIQDHITNAANFISQAANNYHERNTPETVPSPQDADQAQMDEVAPEGWEGTVKSMKKYGDKIDNPWALAYYMKDKGYKSHKKVKEEVEAKVTNPETGKQIKASSALTPDHPAYAAAKRLLQGKKMSAGQRRGLKKMAKSIIAKNTSTDVKE